MADVDLIGIYEIASLAGVTQSAVSNWRKRFTDFPTPIVDLKSGPVFNGAQIQVWLAKRQGNELQAASQYYDQMAAKRGDDPELMAKVEEAVNHLTDTNTTVGSPGMLLGKIQSGKTRAFLGIIARCFDRGYGVAIILTKNNISLARQTLTRVKEDFRELIATEEVLTEDVMSMPVLEKYELNKKLILIVKKEDDNLNRLLDAFENKYPELRDRKVLIIDDEADYASVSSQKKDGIVIVGRISRQISRLRELVKDYSYLEVTATPYCLYLQPEDDLLVNGTPLFMPRRPKFTVILPTHSQYVGGDFYFERSGDVDSPAYYFYNEVPLQELVAVKKPDRRRLRIENVLSENRAEVLRDATVTFIVGGVIRRLQAKAAGQQPEKYSFLLHTEQARESHAWQEEVATAIKMALIEEAKADTPRFNGLLQSAYSDLQRSIKLEGSLLPSFEAVKTEAVNALTGGEFKIIKVNSDNVVQELLAENGQLSLRTPLNMFIGGQILDRGITINNLIAFYYGRNPKKFQQDTVLQHSRMYGARSMADLAVTRFYAPRHVYQIMSKIHERDAALREAFETGAHDRGVYFIQCDAQNRVIPCSPNKLMFSDVVSIRPGRSMLPTEFQTVAKSAGKKNLLALDQQVANTIGENAEVPVLITVEKAMSLLELAYANLEFEDAGNDSRKAHLAALEHLSRTSKNHEIQNKVWLLTATDRNLTRYRPNGRFSDNVDQKQQANNLGSKVNDIPALMLIRQNGKEDQQWRDLPFWWPVIVTPKLAVTTMFANDAPSVA
jgi:hypothetical protein